MDIDDRPVYLEAATVDSASQQGMTAIPGTIDYEFRAYIVSAAWRIAPARWHVIRGHSRDSEGQREMFAALRSLRIHARY